MRHPYALHYFLTAFLFFMAATLATQAQTPGLVYKPAANGGNKILDPNGDGYASLTTAGFPGVNMDEGPAFSEIPYRPFPVFMNEPLSDLGTGAKAGHTDFAPRVYDANGKPVGSPLAAYFDGKNFLFRVRLGGESSASKGYSVLIDTDNSFTGVFPNPGFEFEVVLATNFDVRVYNHKDFPGGGKIIFQGSVDQFSQKAIAGSVSGGDADYFYDFYVPMSAFGGGIVGSTPLRLSGVTVTSAKSGIYGVASDIGGVDDQKYSGDVISAWKDVMTSFPATSPDAIQTAGFAPPTATAPRVYGPVYAGGTRITGASIEAEGSTITVYQNGAPIGTAAVMPNGTWSLAFSSNVLIAGSNITATVMPSGKSVSAVSAPVPVLAALAVPCYTPPPVIVGETTNKKGFLVSSTSGGTLVLYRIDGATETEVHRTAVTAGAVNLKVEICTTGNCLPAGLYVATVQPAGQCVSAKSSQVCFTGGNQGQFSTATAPVITTTSLTAQATLISGTAVAGARVSLTRGGVVVGSVTLGAGATNWSISLSGVVLRDGDVFYARASVTGGVACGTITSERSNAATVFIQSAVPVITGAYCGPTTSISGTSTEAAGTTIRVLSGTTQIGTTTVTSFGTWTAAITGISSGTLTVTAAAPNKAISNGASITINTLFPATSLAITGSGASPTVFEGSTSVKGTAPAGSYVTLYINGAPYVNKDGAAVTTVATGGYWEFTGISPFELYAGSRLTVKAKEAPSAACQSAASAEVTVACNAVNTDISATFAMPRFCPGTPAIIRLNTSEAGVIYNIYNGATPSGSSVLGTGGPLTLTSAPVTVDGTRLTVKTIKVGAPCQSTIGGEMAVALYPPVPNTYTVQASVTSGCPNLKTVFKVVGAETGYSYQLIFNDTRQHIGPAIVPQSNGDISFPEITVAQTTTYGVLIKSLVSGCTDVNGTIFTKTITVTGPSVTQAVTIDHARLCITGENTTKIRVATENNASYTYSVYDSGNPATPVASFAGNGTVVETVIGPFTTVQSRTYYVDVQVAGAVSCLTRLATEVSLLVTDGVPAPVSAGPDQQVCGSTVTLQGSDPAPGTGKWTKATGAEGGTITDEYSSNTTVTGLTSGTYRFTWTVTSSCGSTFFEEAKTVTVTVNCPAEGEVGTNKFLADYEVGDILATIADPDGGIPVAWNGATAFTKKNGEIPPGTAFQAVDNKLLLVVTDKTILRAGNYTFTMRTTDAKGKDSEVPLVIRLYSADAVPAPVTPMPVELVYFTATRQQGLVKLQWLTASERNSKEFVVERSADGKLFERIGAVQGSGNSSLPVMYSFMDEILVAGTVYYRLKQIDFDGEFAYSKVVAVSAKGIAFDVQLQAYPNPFYEELKVTVPAQKSGRGTLHLFDMQGRAVHTANVELQAGLNELTLPLRSVRKGVYILRLTGNGINGTVKVLKN